MTKKFKCFARCGSAKNLDFAWVTKDDCYECTSAVKTFSPQVCDDWAK